MPPALPAAPRPPLPGGYYAFGCASFVPLLGIFVGVVAMVIGFTARKRGGKLLALLGAGGIAFSVILYGSLFYFGFVQRGGVYDGLRAQMAQSTIDALVPQIEFYRLQHGTYPPSLDALRKSSSAQSVLMTFDPSTTIPRPFYYERVGSDHYYLRGVGPDGKAFTADDLIPDVDVRDGSRIGLLKRKANR
ncbi:type II secretion system protein GspG [Rhodanobacter sp. B04]|uniref:type II secretion system protein GspG n=1 Tax=Rhodanobacter sp. B04 TaxID=1945860 RepID=UPI0011156088|nr:type II secretion system protein GspG [Rhodanobacter sp. B04]